MSLEEGCIVCHVLIFCPWHKMNSFFFCPVIILVIKYWTVKLFFSDRETWISIPCFTYLYIFQIWVKKYMYPLFCLCSKRYFSIEASRKEFILLVKKLLWKIYSKISFTVPTFWIFQEILYNQFATSKLAKGRPNCV